MQPTQRSWTRRLAMLAIIGGVIGSVVGLLASVPMVPRYDASAFLLMAPSGDMDVTISEVEYAQAISQVVANPNVLAAAGDTPQLPTDPEKVRTDPSPNAPLIEITVSAATATQAQRQAQAVANAVVAYTEQRDDLLGLRAVLLAPATAGKPAGLSTAAYVAVGAVMGMALGVVAAMLRGPRPAAQALPSEPVEQDVANGRAPVTTAPPS